MRYINLVKRNLSTCTRYARLRKKKTFLFFSFFFFVQLRALGQLRLENKKHQEKNLTDKLTWGYSFKIGNLGLAKKKGLYLLGLTI